MTDPEHSADWVRDCLCPPNNVDCLHPTCPRADTEPTPIADCVVCGGALPRTPWTVMTPDLVDHGPFCSKRCLDDFCALYDETHEEVR